MIFPNETLSRHPDGVKIGWAPTYLADNAFLGKISLTCSAFPLKLICSDPDGEERQLTD